MKGRGALGGLRGAHAHSARHPPPTRNPPRPPTTRHSSFTAADKAGDSITIDKELVNERVSDMLIQSDLSKFIL